jgi:lysophospholipase L1-like esterase
MKCKKMIKIIAAFFVVLTIALISIWICTKVVATPVSYKFDFGSGETTAEGYLKVNAATKYNKNLGYGFNTPENMKDVTSEGSGVLSDAVQFMTYGNDSPNTFNVDLKEGLYKITVYLGNTTRTSVAAEGVLQLINMTGNNAVDSFVIPVTDGQLNILATPGKAGYAYTMSALEIEKVSNDVTTPKTIWVCGDSTVCNYYPFATSVQAGWAQMLNNYIPSEFQIRNMASGGQYAKGFVDAGQFDPILKYGKAGDYYIISMGINDTNYSNSSEYYSVVTDMTKKAKDLGMTVILVKQQGRSDDISKATLLTGRWFGTTLDTIAAEQNVQVVDLFNLAQDYFLSIGQEATTALYMKKDTLHPNRQGADILAKLFASTVTIQ